MALRDMYTGFPVIPVSYSAYLERGQAYLIQAYPGAPRQLVIGTALPRPRRLGRLAAKRWVRAELWKRRMAR